ncbi:MAG: hypothetical protein K8S55_00960, partial [Phycisphaerae bacterium]|nr:hypothetical protein [Phycisphaerae bacterium]
GCTTIAKEGLAAGMGPKGELGVTQPVRGSLRAYQNFEVGVIKDDFGRTPREFMTAIAPEIRKELREEGFPVNKPGKTCVITGYVFYFKKASTLGSVEVAVTKMKLVDKATNQTLGEAVCVGRSTHYSNRGIKKKATGVAKAIAEWIGKHYPKPKKK